MHSTALEHGKRFFDTYFAKMPDARLIEIGAQDVNGTLRSVAPAELTYIGTDTTQGKGVDVVLDDPYHLPFDSETADVVVTSSCFEHSEFFWLVFQEALRVLKPAGIFYLNAPSNGAFHRYPVDCWRFYPDAAHALVAWGKHNGYHPALLESYTVRQDENDLWNDFVAVFIKDETHVNAFPNRILSNFSSFENGWLHGSPDLLNYEELPEDIRRSRDLERSVIDYRARVAFLEHEVANVCKERDTYRAEIETLKQLQNCSDTPPRRST